MILTQCKIISLAKMKLAIFAQTENIIRSYGVLEVIIYHYIHLTIKFLFFNQFFYFNINNDMVIS